MASERTKWLYWDSCVFLAWLNGEKGRVEVIDDILEELPKEQGRRIATTSFSKVETAFAADEKAARQLDPKVEEKLDGLWEDSSIRIVEVHPLIVDRARDLMRSAVQNGLKLKPADALQLATACWLDEHVNPIEAVHTYDTELPKLRLLAGIEIKEPTVLQPRLIRHKEDTS